MAWTRMDMKQIHCITKQHWNGSRLSRKTTPCLEFGTDYKMKRPAQSYLQRNKQRIFWKFIAHIWVLALVTRVTRGSNDPAKNTSCSWRFLTCVGWTLEIDLASFSNRFLKCFINSPDIQKWSHRIWFALQTIRLEMHLAFFTSLVSGNEVCLKMRDNSNPIKSTIIIDYETYQNMSIVPFGAPHFEMCPGLQSTLHLSHGFPIFLIESNKSQMCDSMPRV